MRVVQGGEINFPFSAGCWIFRFTSTAGRISIQTVRLR